MKTIFCAAALGLLGLTSFAASAQGECDKYRTSYDKTYCFAKLFLESDKELNAAYQGKVIIKFVDVWKDKSLAKGFPLEVIPTQFFFTAEGKPFVPKDPDGMRLLMYSLNDTKEHAYTAHQGGMTKEQILAVFHEMGVR